MDSYQIARARIRKAIETRTKELDLCGIMLAELPERIGKATDIEVLVLAENDLCTLVLSTIGMEA